MAECPHCGRPLAVVRPSCLYCGRALPASLVAEAEQSTAAAVAGMQEAPLAGTPDESLAASERVLLILDLRQGDSDALARALGVSAYEAEQRLRRGGYQLHRIAASALAAAAEADAMAEAGVKALAIRERDLIREPLVVRGGALDPRGLRGRCEAGPLQWDTADLLLAVLGPIRREYQVQEKDWRRPRSGAPSEGFRLHLHRRGSPQPLELDPDGFEFEGASAQASSSLLRLTGWLQGFAARTLVDDGFRALPPALALAEEEPDHARTALRRDDSRATPVLDNLRQFRFYSAWRGALERQLRR